MLYSPVLFQMTLSDLAKYSMTRSTTRSLCDSWASCTKCSTFSQMCSNYIVLYCLSILCSIFYCTFLCLLPKWRINLFIWSNTQHLRATNLANPAAPLIGHRWFSATFRSSPGAPLGRYLGFIYKGLGALFYSPVDFTDASDLNTLMQVWCIGEINRWIKQRTR